MGRMILFAAVVVALFWSGSSAYAQQANVVSACGSAAPFGSPAPGGSFFPAVDPGGGLCLSGGALGAKTAILFLNTGESNADGRGLMTDALPVDKLPGARLQVFYSNLFTPLAIGVNNSADPTNYFGCELGWLSAVNAGRVGTVPVFLLKAGFGGTKIAQFAPGDASGIWTTIVINYNNAITQIKRQGYTNVTTVVMYSQGINDALAGTPVATWTTATQNYFATQLRPLVGANSLIIMSKFSAAYATYNAAMDNIAAVDPLTKTIFGDDGLWQGDGAHRTYAGYRQWAEEYMDAWLLPSGQSPVPATAPAGGSGFGTGTVTVTITPAQGEDVYYSTDGSDPLTAAKKYTGPFTVTAPATVKARGVLFNKASSTIVTNAYGS